ncbi:hypothetical protein RJ639_037390, partial [Escallonia herrerae]
RGMRTRRGLCYPTVNMCCEKRVLKRRGDVAGEKMSKCKRQRTSPETAENCDFFDALPDDLVLCILCKLSSTATCPVNLTSVLMTNVEAYYTLGMIRFYCLQNRGSGASLMAKVVISSQALALYSLTVIQFNGSGGSKKDKDLRAGVALCACLFSRPHRCAAGARPLPTGRLRHPPIPAGKQPPKCRNQHRTNASRC